MGKSAVFKIAILVFLAAGAAMAIVYRQSFHPAEIAAVVEKAGAIGPVIFITIYALATPFFLPGSVITIAGGALFGPVWGTLYNLTGATIGAGISFLIARYMVSDWVAKKIGGRLKNLKDGVEEEGWRFVAFVRLVPVFPFSLVNYGLGLTKIKFAHYITTSFVCMAPGAVAYTWIGHTGKQAATGGMAVGDALTALALLAVIAFIPRFVKRMRKRG